MRLSDYVYVSGGELISDGEFDILEYCAVMTDKKTLSFLEKEKFASQVASNVSCIFCKREFVGALPKTVEGICVVDEPKKAFALVHNELTAKRNAVEHKEKTKIGKNCIISPMAYIAEDGVEIGDNVEIEPFVVINRNVKIGNNCVIHSGTTIGGKSFNFVKTADGQVIGMLDAGWTVLEDNVEICSNCHIANGTLPTDITLLEENVKLDAFVHIGHGTKVGRRTFIPAGAQLSGNVIVGEDVWIGVNATVANRLTLGDRSRVSLGSVVTKNVADNCTVSGNFAIEHSKFLEHVKEISRK